MERLKTRYLGLELRSPLVASAGPWTGASATLEQLQDGGAAAVVLPSLFEEEILREDADLLMALEQGSEHFAEALDYFPGFDTLESSAERYLSLVRRAKERLQVPLIASLNATSDSGWVRYARLIEDAGADALELNLYRVAADPTEPGAHVESRDLAIIHRVREAITIPLAVKLSPYYSSLANLATAVVDAGVDGLVLMNRFYQPDIDVATRAVVPSVELSRPSELRLPVRWTAILRPQVGGRVSLAVSTGVHSGEDVVKALLAGADVAMMTSAVLLHGTEHFATVERQVLAWMDENGFATPAEFRGSVSYAASDDPSAYERAGYRRTLHARMTPWER
jgi:dihydroorotate dehydrogenase (fumarate)